MGQLDGLLGGLGSTSITIKDTSVATVANGDQAASQLISLDGTLTAPRSLFLVVPPGQVRIINNRTSRAVTVIGNGSGTAPCAANARTAIVGTDDFGWFQFPGSTATTSTTLDAILGSRVGGLAVRTESGWVQLDDPGDPDAMLHAPDGVGALPTWSNETGTFQAAFSRAVHFYGADAGGGNSYSFCPGVQGFGLDDGVNATSTGIYAMGVHLTLQGGATAPTEFHVPLNSGPDPDGGGGTETLGGGAPGRVHVVVNDCGVDILWKDATVGSGVTIHSGTRALVMSTSTDWVKIGG